MLITVAIPTHNRPALLREALASVAAQTHPDWEAVVVDDGSTPPVSETVLRDQLGERARLVRHDRAQGIAATKNAGVAAAQGEVVLHLDDDDVLDPGALAQIDAVYDRHPALDCLFLNVEPFGSRAPGTAFNQSEALDRLRERAQSRVEGDVAFFHEGLFAALLKSVPMAMQRPAARTTLWTRVGPLRRESYLPEPEWAIKSALYGQPALLLNSVYRARVDGQNSFSQPEQRLRHMHAAIDTRSTLLDWVDRNADLAPHRREIRRSLAGAYFNEAWHHHLSGQRHAAWRPLFAAFTTDPQWSSLRLGLRMLLGSGAHPPKN